MCSYCAINALNLGSCRRDTRTMGLICGIKWYLHTTHCSVTSCQFNTDQANSPLRSKELFDLAAECGKRHTLLECANDLLELQHAHTAKLRGKLRGRVSSTHQLPVRLATQSRTGFLGLASSLLLGATVTLLGAGVGAAVTTGAVATDVDAGGCGAVVACGCAGAILNDSLVRSAAPATHQT